MELRERNQETFREKVRAKFQNRDFKPEKDHSDTMAMSVFFFMLLTLLYECLFHLVPAVYPESRLFHSLVTVFLFVETLFNWHRSYFDVDNYVRETTKEKYFPGMQETPPDWRLCLTCQVDAPPRSHHCKKCGKCMLKRDHHCFFTGSCIGFFNQKFFVVFCLWASVSLMYCVGLQVMYLNQDLPLNSAQVMAYIAPVTVHKWVMGYITFGQLCIVAHMYLSILFLMVTSFFFAWQCLIISQGFTCHEAWKRIFVFQEPTMRENIKSVFGSFLNIPLLIVWPYRVAQPGNGVQWNIRRKRVKGQ